MFPLPIDLLKATALAAASSHPEVQLIVLFGSVARGQPRPDSDADIAILGGGLWQMQDVATKVAAALGRDADVVDLGAASELLRFYAARDGVLLYERQQESWARFQADAAVRYFDLAPLRELCAQGVRRRLAREAKHYG